MSNVWETLSKIDCSDHTEEKNGLTYLSWAWAWGMLKSKYPSASFTKHIWHADTWLSDDGDDTNRSGLPYTSDKSGYAYVMVTVKVEEESITEVFPVLDYRNKAVQNPDAFAVNTALQRCLAKCIAMHGLGHYIYAGEDLPQGTERKHVIESKDGEKKEVEGLSLVAEVFKTFIPECDSVDALRGFWATNKQAIEELKKDDVLYKEVLSNFTAHKEKLEPKGEAA